MLMLWRSANCTHVNLKDWQQHGDGKQIVRTLNLGEKNASSADVAWMQLPCADNCELGEGQFSDHGAMAILFDSGWLLLLNLNGDTRHQQRIFRADIKQPGHWRPVCSYSRGLLLLTAPNAVYVVQVQDIVGVLAHHVASPTDLPVAAFPLPANLKPPQYVLFLWNRQQASKHQC
jgi:hypothetical protein